MVSMVQHVDGGGRGEKKGKRKYFSFPLKKKVANNIIFLSLENFTAQVRLKIQLKSCKKKKKKKKLPPHRVMSLIKHFFIYLPVKKRKIALCHRKTSDTFVI